jgi:predicted ATPase with chaperone activity
MTKGASGGGNMLMIGPPGAGKSMLASRLAGLLPPLDPREALEVSMVQSLAGELPDGTISRNRPFRSPHHSASMAALIGGGLKVNAEAEGELLDRVAKPDPAGQKLLMDAAERIRLTARGYHRVLRVARTIADLAGADAVNRGHVAEAISYRRIAHAG